MDNFLRIYYIIWSILAIIGGILLLFFREGFTKLSKRIFQSWYEKTKFFVFRIQAENVDSASNKIIIMVIAIIFIIFGIITFIQNI